MVDLDGIRTDVQGVEDLHRNAEDLRVGEHGVVDARDVKIALVELAHAALCHCGLVAAVDLGDLVAFDGLDCGVHCEPARERDGKVIAEGTDLTALVGEVVD